MSLTFSMKVSPSTETVNPLSKKQLKAIDLRADGNSWDQIAKKMDVTPRTIQRWRALPEWAPALKRRQEEWIEEYEAKFTRMMPTVAHTHIKLLHSPNEAIQMRAVDSAHANHVRCVKEAETKSEVQVLTEMVHALTEQLAQERAKG